MTNSTRRKNCMNRVSRFRSTMGISAMTMILQPKWVFKSGLRQFECTPLDDLHGRIFVLSLTLSLILFFDHFDANQLIHLTMCRRKTGSQINKFSIFCCVYCCCCHRCCCLLLSAASRNKNYVAIKIKIDWMRTKKKNVYSYNNKNMIGKQIIKLC